jgi:membrane protein DedA with SNARE-associated domain/rhodanese-related sulfurtransferase
MFETITMSGLLDQFVGFGYAAVFLYVLLSQLGVPVPAAPMMLAVGALAATGRIVLAPAAAAVVLACLCADTLWYGLGRTRGRRVVRFLCRLSLEPGSCVQRTDVALHRYGPRFLLVSKFIPGLGLMAAPVAGESGTPYARFIVFDAVGALLWASTYLLLGRLFGGVLERNARVLHLVARFGGGALLLAVLALVASRLVRRSRFRSQLTSIGISPSDLKSRMDLGEAFYIVDIRPRAHGRRSESLPGAIHLTSDEAIAGAAPTDREVIVLCDCPGDAGSALVATRLRSRGLEHAQHLVGGLDAWTRAGYPLVEIGPPASVIGDLAVH